LLTITTDFGHSKQATKSQTDDQDHWTSDIMQKLLLLCVSWQTCLL